MTNLHSSPSPQSRSVCCAQSHSSTPTDSPSQPLASTVRVLLALYSQTVMRSPRPTGEVAQPFGDGIVFSSRKQILD